MSASLGLSPAHSIRMDLGRESPARQGQRTVSVARTGWRPVPAEGEKLPEPAVRRTTVSRASRQCSAVQGALQFVQCLRMWLEQPLQRG